MRAGSVARVEVVQPMRNHVFCQNCTRMRVTSTGYFKPCLMRSDNYTSFVNIIRNKRGSSALDAVFRRAVETREPYWKQEDSVDSKILCQVPGSNGN